MTADETLTGSIGSRLALVQGQAVRYGTMRYEGPVEGTKGTWLGVEWDDENKGKHDGSHQGHRYFDCCRQGNIASFIRRPTKSKALNVGGSAFLEVLADRYSAAPATSLPPLDQSVSASAGPSRRNLAEIDIETPNMEKVARKFGQLEKLKRVVLSGPSSAQGLDPKGAIPPQSEEELIEGIVCLVGSVAGSISSSIEELDVVARRINDTVPLLDYLDLSRSMIRSWSQVAWIVQHSTRLKRLCLHQNRLPLPGSSFDPDVKLLSGISSSAGFAALQELGLNESGINWTHGLTVAQHLPRLRVLELAHNGISQLSRPTTLASTLLLQDLMELHLTANVLASWDDIVEELGPLPRLGRLYLAHNNIEAIPPPMNSEGRTVFASLRHISLSDNPMLDLDLEGPATEEKLARCWSSLYALDQWASGLKSLSALPGSNSSNNGESSASVMHWWSASIIARLPNLETLNGVDITPLARKDAELWWLGQVTGSSKEEGTLTGRDPSIAAQSEPARSRLLSKYHLEPDRQQDQPATGGQGLKRRLTSLTVRLSSSSPDPSALSLSAVVKTIDGVQLLPSASLRVCRSKIFKSLGIPPTFNKRSKSGAGSSESWYGCLASGDAEEATSSRAVVALTDEAKSLDHWGFGQSSQGSLRDELWLCFAAEDLERLQGSL